MYDYVKIPYGTQYFESNLEYIESVEDSTWCQEKFNKEIRIPVDVFADGIVLKQDNVFRIGNISFLYKLIYYVLWIST